MVFAIESVATQHVPTPQNAGIEEKGILEILLRTKD